MPGTIEFPQVVQDAVEQFGDLFANQPQRRHFAEYLTGLMIAERKSVLGINREFAQTTSSGKHYPLQFRRFRKREQCEATGEEFLDGQGQTRHMYLVMLAYTLLMDQLGQNRAKQRALRKLTTIGEACRVDHITVRLHLT